HNTPDYTEAWITYRIPSGVYTDAVKYTVQLIGNGTSESEIYLKDIQLEQKPYKTTWHPYNSTRSLETLTIPTAGVLNPQEGTVEFIVIPKTPHVNPGGDPWWNDFTWGTPGTNGFLIRRGVDTGAVNRFQVELYGTAIGKVQLNYDATFQQDTPYHIAFRWNNAGCALLVDGIKRAATTYLYAAPSATEAQVGYRPNNRRADALIDSLRLSKRAYTDAEIAEHAAATTPPTEGGQSMNADLWPIRAVGQQIWLDSTGLYMKNASAPNIMMHLNSERLAFWDTSGMPSIGIGEVTDMAQQLGWPDNLYGLLIAQGLIVAHQGVLGDALTDYGTTRTKIEDGSIDRNKIEDYSITMTKIEPRSITIGTLSDTLSVTIPDRLQLFQSITGPNVLTNPGFETGNLTGWTASSTSYIVVNSTAKYEGTYGCQFKAYSDTLSLYQDYPASPNQRWLAQVRVYQSDYAGIYIKLRFLNSARSILSTTSKGSVTPGWCDIAAEAVAPANTAYVRFELYRNPVDGSDYYADDCKLCMAPTALTTSYQTVDTIVVPRTEAVEQLQLTASFRKSVAGANTITWSALINGQRKFETTPGTVTLDVRGISGDLTIEFQAKADVSPAKTSWVGASCYINQRLPLRGAAPRYSVTEVLQASCNMTCERACQTTCQLSCQASCQTSCQTTCQDTCQTACQATCQDVCQSSCQSTCELTTQGGGCFVEGTPVSVYDAETGEVTEIPIEALAPGMLMPAYDPNTDTVAVTECISNVRSKTGTLFVIEVEGGHVLRATGEQPFDVLRPNALTGEVRWQKLQARYLKPGDVMIRPFDEANRTPKVVSVTEIIVPATWVWNPHTASGRYIADGFADATKMLV
ncbi:MAG: hypothetical protein PWR07_1119, partial [Bacillota bacterium]|nr:hypothetical protein [Bacillota bacterium]